MLLCDTLFYRALHDAVAAKMATEYARRFVVADAKAAFPAATIAVFILKVHHNGLIRHIRHC